MWQARWRGAHGALAIWPEVEILRPAQVPQSSSMTGVRQALAVADLPPQYLQGHLA